jgi:Coenzyme PQQ synthesis protein D (PqqD)
MESIVCAISDQVSCDLDGEAAILNLQSGTYYGLDPVGAFIWSQLVAPQPVRAIAASMLERYDVSSERCQHDLLTLLGQLDERGLLEIRPPSVTDGNEQSS